MEQRMRSDNMDMMNEVREISAMMAQSMADDYMRICTSLKLYELFAMAAPHPLMDELVTNLRAVKDTMEKMNKEGERIKNSE